MVEDTFAAAHQLVGYQGPCENLHGHTFRVQVFLIGEELKKEGFLVDFKQIKTELREIIKEFDHHNLNELEVFKKQNPTSENIARTVYERMKKKLPVSKVTIWESPTSAATYYEGKSEIINPKSEQGMV